MWSQIYQPYPGFQFRNVTVSSDDDLEADFNYIWFRDDAQQLGEDTCSGLGSDQMNITVSTPA